MNKFLKVAAFITVAVTLFSCGQSKFKKLKSGLEYKILSKGKSGKKAVVGSMITMNIKTMIRDSVLYDSYKMSGQPVPAQVTKPSFNGDNVMEGIALLSEGDSAIIQIPADTLFHGNRPMPEFIKKGDTMKFIVKILTVQTEDEFKKTQEENASKQNGIDDKIIQDYIAKNNLNAQKTPSGVYYIIEKTGNGKHPTSADKVTVHYNGTLLDGTKFDSSYDKGQPIEIELSRVVKGWADGIPMFDEGGKGKLIIPSSLAYGTNPPPGSPIKPNSILLFDIELIKIAASK